MADEKTNDRVTASRRRAPGVALRQCMMAVRTRCGDLATAISNHDEEAVEFMAHNAVNLWLAGRAAYRRLIAHFDVASPYAASARLLLEELYMDLLQLFTSAAETLAVPRMTKTLRDLRRTLTTAMVEPIVSNTTDNQDCKTRQDS